MYRFYCPQSDFSSQTVFITDRKEIHHITRVLRLKNNEQVQIFNDQGEEATSTILSLTPQKITLQVGQISSQKSRLPKIILACAIPKKGKFEFIIEKATELGVSAIIPLKTHRTEIQLIEKRLEKKMVRFQTVAINAAKQSRRNTIPTIYPFQEFKESLEYLSTYATLVIPSLEEKKEPLLNTLGKIKDPHAIVFFIGPEGDFTPEEYTLAKQKGCMAVSLGPTILKVETAAIATVACANLFFHSCSQK